MLFRELFRALIRAVLVCRFRKETINGNKRIFAAKNYVVSTALPKPGLNFLPKGTSK